MSTKPSRLLWEGSSRLDTALELIAEKSDFELQLPPDYHFALFRHMHPDADRSAPEQVDVEGGAELLGKIAGIRGLDDLGNLIHPLSNAGARLHVISPGPSVHIHFPES